MVRGSRLLAIAILAASASSGPVARADGPDVDIAVYAPWAGPSTADARHAFALEIERAVEGAGLGRVSVSTYAKLADFRRELASGKMDVFLIDSGATGALGKRASVVAAWSSGSRWVLAGATAHERLEGLRLALQAPDAPSSKRTVSRLLRGQVTSKYWRGIIGAPVTDDARQLVLRNRADVVLLPEGAAEGLNVLVDVGTFSELALAVAEDRPGAAEAAAVVQDTVRARFGGTWSKGKPVFPRAVGATTFVSAAMAAGGTSFLDLLSPARSEPPAFDVDDMWIDPNAP